MAVKLITRERIERTMTRTDHVRLGASDVKALNKLSADINASIAFLMECEDAIRSRISHRPNAEVLLAASPQVEVEDWRKLPPDQRPVRCG